jgi:anti-sigma B factor antagonist
MEESHMAFTDRLRDTGALNLVSTFFASFPPSAEPSQEPELASLPRVREEGILTIETHRDGNQVVVRADGELDIASSKGFEDELHRAIDSDASTVVLDLSGLSFIDSTGLRALVAVSAHSHNHGDRLRILRGPEAVERVLEVSGLDRQLPLAD